MTGLASLVLSIWGYAKNKNVVSRRLFVAVGVVCILCAVFLAWEDEHAALQREERSHAYNLQATIIDVLAEEINGRPAVIARMDIRNLGLPTVVHEYQMMIDSPAYHQKGDPFVPQRPFTVDLPGLGELMMSKEDCLVEKTSSSPLATGGRVVGYFAVLADGMKYEDFLKAILTIGFKDVALNQYSSKVDISTHVVNAPDYHLGHVPGMQLPTK